MEELAPAGANAIVFTALSNAETSLNPYAGLEAPGTDDTPADQWAADHWAVPGRSSGAGPDIMRINTGRGTCCFSLPGPSGYWRRQTFIRQMPCLAWVHKTAACSWRTIVLFTIHAGDYLTSHGWSLTKSGDRRPGAAWCNSSMPG